MQTHRIETRWDTLEMPAVIVDAFTRRRARPSREDDTVISDTVERVIHQVMGWMCAAGILAVAVSAVSGG